MLDQTYSSSFEVEQVVDQKLIDGQTHFLVKWAGYDHSQNTWEPLRHMTHSKDKIKEWQQFKITQLNLTSHKKLHDQVNIGPEKNRKATRNSQTFKNVFNPYKKVYLRIDEEDEHKIKGPEQGRPSIQTIFDQPQMKRLIKVKKSQRKKKELEMFEKRLKTRPKIWQKYLQNEESVIKRASEKIKQVIDKAYGGNKLLNNNEKDLKQKKFAKNQINEDKTKNKFQSNQIQAIPKKSPLQILESKRQKHLNNQNLKPQRGEISSNNKNVLSQQQKPALIELQTRNQLKPIKQKFRKKVKNIFSSTQEDECEIQQNKQKLKIHAKQKNLKAQTQNVKNLGLKKNQILLHDSSLDQETNIVSFKERQQCHNELYRDKHLVVQKTKPQNIFTLSKDDKVVNNNINCLQRKRWVNDLIKGIVEQNKKKGSIQSSIEEGQKRKFFTIEPQTILLTQSMIRKIKVKKAIFNQNECMKVMKEQMSKISEQSSRNSYFSKKSSVSNYVHEGMFRLNKVNCEFLNQQVESTNTIEVNQNKKQVFQMCNYKIQKSEHQKIQQGYQIRKQMKKQNYNQNQESNQKNTNKQLVLKLLPPFQCSLSSINQSLNKNSRNSSIMDQYQFDFKIRSQNNTNSQSSKSVLFNSQSNSSHSQQIDEDSQESETISDQESSERIINYSTLTNHISTALPQSSSSSQNFNRNQGIAFLNLIRQQSMSTRASQITQLPLQNIPFHSQSLPASSLTYQVSQMQNQFQIQKPNISLKQLQAITDSCQIPVNHQNQSVLQIKNHHQLQKSCQIINQQISPYNCIFKKSFQKINTQIFQQKSLEKNQQKNNPKQQKNNKEKCQIQEEVLDYFFQLQNSKLHNFSENEKNQQIQLQIFQFQNEDKKQEKQQPINSFIKQKSNESINKSSIRFSNRDKGSLILEYDLSSIN